MSILHRIGRTGPQRPAPNQRQPDSARARATVIGALAALTFSAAVAHGFEFSAERLAEAPFLTDGWAFQAVASIQQALDDGPPAGADAVAGDPERARIASPLLRVGDVPEGWSGAGWFSFDFTVSSDLVGIPIGISMPVLRDRLTRKSGTNTRKPQAAARPIPVMTASRASMGVWAPVRETMSP